MNIQIEDFYCYGRYGTLNPPSERRFEIKVTEAEINDLSEFELKIRLYVAQYYGIDTYLVGPDYLDFQVLNIVRAKNKASIMAVPQTYEWTEILTNRRLPMQPTMLRDTRTLVIQGVCKV